MNFYNSLNNISLMVFLFLNSSFVQSQCLILDTHLQRDLINVKFLSALGIQKTFEVLMFYLLYYQRIHDIAWFCILIQTLVIEADWFLHVIVILLQYSIQSNKVKYIQACKYKRIQLIMIQRFSKCLRYGFRNKMKTKNCI